MNPTMLKAAGLILGGAIGGFLGGFLLGERQGARQVIADTEEELRTMEERLKKQYKIGAYSQPMVYADEDGAEAEYANEPVETMVTPELLNQLQAHLEHQGYALKMSDPKAEDEEEVSNLFTEYGATSSQAGVNPNVDDDEPYVISELMFMQSSSENISLEWYVKDSVLADEQDQVVEDVETTVGLNNLLNWPTDATVLYVHNPRLDVDFEIAGNPGSYSHMVLGVDPEPSAHRRKRPASED